MDAEPKQQQGVGEITPCIPLILRGKKEKGPD
jgi:hypothetical protein